LDHDLFKTLGEIELNLKLLEVRKTFVMQQLLEQLRDGHTTPPERGETAQDPSQDDSAKARPESSPV